jgi:type II secretory pathway component PulF
MPKYLATIKEQNGATKTMVVEALDRNGAILSIQRQGVFLIS